MKAWYLLLGLMVLCAAGVGTVNSSNGYLADQNPTPFLIFGHVWYEGGAPCNSPIVNMTNPGTGGAWYADTVSDSNYYQTLLTLADVNAGDVLRWSVTDGTVFDTTNRTVGQSDLESGGIFGFDMVLQSIAPMITGYAPESQIRDIENAARRFNVTIDQVVDVMWLINGSPTQTNESVTDASYTHTNVAIGVWNVSARASNANGTDIQEWIWNVTTLPPPVNRSRMLGYSSSNATEPVLFVVYGWVFYENRSECIGAVVNITNLNTSAQWQAETRPGHYYYQLMLDAANISTGDVLQIDASKGGVLINSTRCNITDAEVSDGAAMVDLNEGSIDLTVSGILPPGGFYAGRNSTIVAVVANNGTACTGGFEAALFVNDGTPTGTVHVPSIGPGGNRSINFNWMPDHEGNHTIVVMADSGWAINEIDESNNNRSVEVYVRFTDIDLVVMDDVTLNKTPLDGDVVGVDVTIENQGNDSAENFTVAFHDNNNVFHTEVMSLDAGDSDTLSACWYPRYGEHDVRVIIDCTNTIRETDETNNERSLGVSVNRSRDFTITNVTLALDGMPCNPLELEWGMTVTVNATIEAVNLANRDCPVSVKFYRNAHGWYPSRDINETELLFETGNSIQCVAVEWNIEYYGSIGNRTMTVIVDPDDEIDELDESNNEAVIPIRVKACDFTVTDIAANVTSVIFGEIVELNATIRNLGDAAWSVDVAFMANSTDVPENRDISVSNVSVDAGGTEYATIHWNTSKTNLAGNCMVTVEVDPDYRVCETNETNNSMMAQDLIFVNGTDLAVCSVTLDTDGIGLYQGDVVNVSALIENRGAIDAFDFSVGFNDRDAHGNVSLVELTNISSLLAGGFMCVNATWDLSGAIVTNHTMLVRIDHGDNPENDVGNNENGVEREVKTPWKVVNISFPRFPDEDEDVTIAATVRNNGRRAGIASVEFYLDDKLFKEKKLYVGANSTNSTGVVWNTRLQFIGPTNIQTNHWIRVDAGDHAWDNQEITIVPANLTADISLNPDYNMTVTARNNEDRTVNTTLWIYDVDHTVYTINESGELRISNPDALNMSTHFFGEIDHKTDGGYKVRDDDGNSLDSKMFDGWGTTELDVWSIWGAGGNVTIKYWDLLRGAPVRPGYATIESGALISSMPLTLDAGETKNLMIEWNVTERNHTLWAQLGGTNDSIDLNFDIDLAINVSMNDTMLDGDQDTITADITNFGHGNASSFKVEFSNDINLFHTEYVTYLDGNSTTTVTAVWTADTWNESEEKATLNHTMKVEIVPCGNADINLSNNRINKVVRVNPTRDFSVTNITFVQDEVTEETTIGALIRNFGRAGSTSVSICVNNSAETTPIYSGSHWVDSECYVNVTWNASMVGDCTINVTADPDTRTLETDESNNSMTLPVYIGAPDLTVESLMIDPIDLIEGNTTNVTATVANIGDRDVDDVTVAFGDRGNYIQHGYWEIVSESEIMITQPDAACIRLHFARSRGVSLYDGNGNLVETLGGGRNLWTGCIPGSSVKIKAPKYSSNGYRSTINKYEYYRVFNRTTISLGANTSKAIHVNWTAYPSGPHEIGVFVDPDDVILELNETNNELMNSIVVQGPDLSVDLELNNTNPVDGDIINITACIKNVGVLPANNFTARIEIDDECISESVNITLLRNETLNISTIWKATIGDHPIHHLIQVIADPDEIIFETSEENNADSITVFVNSPDLNVTIIELNPADPVDGDETWINATITNQGFQQANNFSADIFYKYGKFEGALAPCERYSVAGGDPWGERWVNLTWNNKTVDAGCIYIHIEEISGNPMLSVFDGNNTPVTNSTTSRWIAVIGNATNISIYAGVQGHSRNSIALRFYAGNMTQFNGLTLDINESATLGMRQKVSTGSHDIRVFADAGNSVNENNKENNIRKETVEVQPSRDFLISYMSVSANGSPINTNNTPLDGDPVTVNAIVGNTGFRTGIVDIEIIDEHGWVDANPRYELNSSGYYAYVIGYPGADAIRVHFSKLNVSPNNVVEIRDENETLLCTISKSTSVSPWLYSDEIYVYRVMKPTAYGTYKHIACDIDMYQYRRINRTTKELAANGTAYIPACFNSSAGNHTIYMIADPHDKIGELDESNNEANETIYVKPCRDPAAVNITFSPEMPYPGKAVNITAIVTNNGNRNATFTVDLTALKSEYRPYESPHGSGLTRGFDEAITTYPEANWTGVHFTEISTVAGFAKTFLRIYDRGGNMSTYYYGFKGDDIWEWVCGNVSRLTIPKLGEGANIDGCNIDRVAHIVVLNRTTVTLRPGEIANITGILPNVRIGHRSISYTVTAMVDQNNTAFETDESNNAVSKVLTARCPDLTVGENLHFTNDGKAKVMIKNIGTGEADDVEVRFWHDADFNKYKKEHHMREHNGMEFPPRYAEIEDPDEDSDKYPNAIRVHFDELRIHRGTLRVWNETTKIHTIPPGNYPDKWVEVEGEECSIYYDSAHVRIDRYEYAKDESVGDISGGRTKGWEIPWVGYEAPYNLTVIADIGDSITESDEDNNDETVLIYADLRADWIEFVSPTIDKLSLDAEKFIINGHITNGGANDAAFPVSEFNVTLEVRRRYQNGTIIDLFNVTKYVEEPFSDGQNTIQFEFDPEEKFKVGGDYIVSLIADSTGDICESNGLYPFGEDNNVTSEVIHVYNSSGYTGGGELINVAQGEVNGRVVYTVGDEGSCEYIGMTDSGGGRTVKYTGVIPDDSSSIEFARLFVHWFTWYSEGGRRVPVLAGMDTTFNGHSLTAAGNYSDNPVATAMDAGYGLYSYDVTDHVTSGENEAIVRITSDWRVGIHAIGLLVVYEDEDEPLTKYWVNEGADIMMAANSDYPTGLSDGDCITTATFDGVEQVDMENVNATLLTVLGFYAAYCEPSDDALEFNDKSIGCRMHSDGMSGYWEHHCRKTGIALTMNEWEDVTDHLKRDDNLVEIQSLGNFMMPNNAFLRLIFPPDLNVINLTAPASTVVGAHHSINATIRNDGRSDAHDFNVTFHIDGKQMVRIPHLDLPAGENMTIHLYNWTPMLLVHVYNLTAAADVLSGEDWTEIETDNNAMTKHVTIEEGGFGNQTGPRGTGGGSNPTGGEYTEKITGRVMQGIKEFLSFGGGGGAGMFSLTEWIMKGTVWLVLLLFVCTGYRMEQRSYGRVGVPGYARGL